MNDPVSWIRDMTGMQLWSKQREAAELIVLFFILYLEIFFLFL